MKFLRNMLLFALTVIMLLSCVSCSSFVQMFDNEEIRTYTETMLDSILADDFDGAYAVINDICTEDEFVSTFNQINNALSDVQTYELSLLSINKNSNMTNGEVVNSIAASYKMTTNLDTYIVDVQTISTYDKLSSFYITPYEETDYYYTGTINNMKNATVMQWIMLLLNLVAIGITVFALVDCCRKKIKLKALWIIIIILGMVTVGVTFGASVLRFNFNIAWLFAYSAYIIYGGGTVVFRLMIPVGSIIYFALRKLLIKKTVSVPENEQISEEQD